MASPLPLTSDRWTLEGMLHAAEQALANVTRSADRRPLAILRRRVRIRLALMDARLW